MLNTKKKPLSTQFIRKHVESLNQQLQNSTYQSKFKSDRASYGFENFFVQRSRVTSNASRSSYYLRSNFFLQTLYKKFKYTTKLLQGRDRNGILCRTKGRRTSHSTPSVRINKSFRLLSLCFIAGFFILPFKFKSVSLVISSSGNISYVNSTLDHYLFKTSKLNSVFTNYNFLKKYQYLSDFIKIPQLFYLVYQLPKFKLINSVELKPGKGVQYVLSSGSKSVITKISLKTSLALIKLPSGVQKIFSAYSVGSLNSIPFAQKNIKTRSNAGFFKKKGKKSLTRGVAKNPVDHPHGGRNKAIKYQRTP